MSQHCKHYTPWAVVASSFHQEEINDACVNNEKRTIKHCLYCRKQTECPEYEEETK